MWHFQASVHVDWLTWASTRLVNGDFEVRLSAQLCFFFSEITVIHSCHNSHLLVRRSINALYETNCYPAAQREKSCRCCNRVDWGRTYARKLCPLLPHGTAGRGVLGHGLGFFANVTILRSARKVVGRFEPCESPPSALSKSGHLLGGHESIKVIKVWAMSSKNNSLNDGVVIEDARMPCAITTTWTLKESMFGLLHGLLMWVWGIGGAGRGGFCASARHGRIPLTSCGSEWA